MQRLRRPRVGIRAYLWLAVLLFLQWSSAHAHCLRLTAATVEAGHGIGTGICGLPSKAVPDDGTSPVKGPHATPSDCPACNALSAASVPQPPVLLVPGTVALVHRTLPLRAGLALPPARAPPQQPRAPPEPA